MNKIIIDWLSFSIKYEGTSGDQIFRCVQNYLSLHNMKWELLKGMYGYKDRYYFSGISIHLNNDNHDAAWVEMSGQGCRAFEEYSGTNWDDLISLLVSDLNVKINRLDIAYDDFDGLLDIDQLCMETMKENFTSRWRKYEVIISNGGNSVIHGSRQSNMLLRIYDKAKEQKLLEGQHWIRAELQMRDDNAAGFLRALYLAQYDLGQIFAGALLNYLRYIVPGSDSHDYRHDSAPFWEDFIGNAEKIRVLSSPGLEYTIDDLQHYVVEMAGNATKTYMEIIGEEEFVKQLKNREFRKNEKYRRLREAADLFSAIHKRKNSEQPFSSIN